MADQSHTSLIAKSIQTVTPNNDRIFKQETTKIAAVQYTKIMRSPLEQFEEKTTLRKRKYKALKNWSKSMKWIGSPKWIKAVIA